MGVPYIGEIRLFAGNFAPVGWSTCDGQQLQIGQFDTLFTLIGTTYGGDGQTTFNLPNLAGRVPVHMGRGSSGTTYALGEVGGASGVTLTTSQLPPHTHTVIADDNAQDTTQTTPTNTVYGNTAPTNIYSAGTGPLHPMMALQASGGNEPHNNMQPYQAISFIIALYGIYPSPS